MKVVRTVAADFVFESGDLKDPITDASQFVSTNGVYIVGGYDYLITTLSKEQRKEVAKRQIILWQRVLLED